MSGLLEDIIAAGQLTMFVGAGISKPPPTSAPVWREMQKGAIESLYGRLKAEHWPVDAGFFDDERILREFSFRPEVFWNKVQKSAGMDFVYAAYQVLAGGLPNSNHYAIAQLLHDGIVSHVITTNFDEYIDALLDDKVRKIRCHAEASALLQQTTDGAIERLEKTYLKLHGTLSDRTR